MSELIPCNGDGLQTIITAGEGKELSPHPLPPPIRFPSPLLSSTLTLSSVFTVSLPVQKLRGEQFITTLEGRCLFYDIPQVVSNDNFPRSLVQRRGRPSAPNMSRNAPPKGRGALRDIPKTAAKDTTPKRELTKPQRLRCR